MNHVDAWIQAIASVLGAVLAAGIAIWVMSYQIRVSSMEKRKKQRNDFLKAWIIIEGVKKSTDSAYRDIFSNIGSGHQDSQKKYLEDAIKIFNENYNLLTLIKEEYIPLNVYKDYLQITMLCKLVTDECVLVKDNILLVQHFLRRIKEIEFELGHSFKMIKEFKNHLV